MTTVIVLNTSGGAAFKIQSPADDTDALMTNTYTWVEENIRWYAVDAAGDTEVRKAGRRASVKLSTVTSMIIRTPDPGESATDYWHVA